ncbi:MULTISPECIES: TIGR04211 family SH3 domain-containing protein [unclassified Arsukibacterium]|uniref:TIGR04211 family SH3 domain-containing protein n=1 Tax=unclassified Arsukibacterium TaxID=2635278 RepID=UPI000C3C7D33|nr:MULTISPECIES: TIGR04211 family SH3 domain-containing protein [unclassified Arsukibacterium]MAA94691.1 peptide-binding protein [Rheinheimera sp.]MBM33758.1 peptide-binding protein [Rheinheimera sp.]
MFRLFRSSVSRIFFLPILLMVVSLPVAAQQESIEKEAFISDALFVYLHSGPGNQYRIVGTINAGQPVTYLSEDTDSGYAQIRYEDNKTGWLPKEYVSYTPGLVTQLETLTESFNSQRDQIQQLEQERNELSSQLNSAIVEREKALEQLAQGNRSYEQLKTQLEATQTSIWQNPMVIGSAILLIGLIFGLVLPALWPKRRDSERWM